MAGVECAAGAVGAGALGAATAIAGLAVFTVFLAFFPDFLTAVFDVEAAGAAEAGVDVAGDWAAYAARAAPEIRVIKYFIVVSPRAFFALMTEDVPTH